VTGGTVSTTVTVWVQFVLLPQLSETLHVQVKIFGQRPFETTFKTTVLIVGSQQVVVATGVSKVQSVPQDTVLLVGQTTLRIAGGAVTIKSTVHWLTLLFTSVTIS
jgi:hypothetical protein